MKRRQPGFKYIGEGDNSRPVKTEHYKGHTIEVTEKLTSGLWAAEIRILPDSDAPGSIDMGSLDGYSTQAEAEDKGIQWGEYRIDLHAQNKLQKP